MNFLTSEQVTRFQRKIQITDQELVSNHEEIAREIVRLDGYLNFATPPISKLSKILNDGNALFASNPFKHYLEHWIRRNFLGRHIGIEEISLPDFLVSNEMKKLVLEAIEAFLDCNGKEEPDEM